MELLKGKPISDKICEEIKIDAIKLNNMGIHPTLGILRVGNNAGDIAYEKSIEKKAKNLKIDVKKYILEENSTEQDVLIALDAMNNNKNIHGILMFRPLPEGINETNVVNQINPDKDVDGISRISISSLFAGSKIGYPPCTAEAVIEILKYYGIEISGKKVTVIGRSLVIGKPVAMMLLEENATVTICHSKTNVEDLKNICQNSDIIVSAIGKVKFLTEEFVNNNQIIIDVGINFDELGKMCGDVDFDNIDGKVKAITPVPGGVGSVTTALLLKHTVEAAKEYF